LSTSRTRYAKVARLPKQIRAKTLSMPSGSSMRCPEFFPAVSNANASSYERAERKARLPQPSQPDDDKGLSNPGFDKINAKLNLM